MINLDFRILLDDFYSNCIFVHCTDQTNTCLFNHAHSRACYVCFENLVLAQVCKIEQNVSPSSLTKKIQSLHQDYQSLKIPIDKKRSFKKGLL